MKIICYLSFGFPTLAKSLEMAEVYIEGGADMIEMSIPAKDPFIDTVYTANRMKEAIKGCGDYAVYLKELAAFRKKHPDFPITLVMYEDTIVEIGPEALVNFCRENGIGDLIYVGLKDPGVKEKLISGGIRISCPITYQVEKEDVDSAIHSNGFVYMEYKAQSIPKKGFETLDKCIRYIREVGITRPIYCGVGVYTPDDVRYAKKCGGDGVFIGSALIELYDDPEKLRAYIADFKKAALE